MVVTVGRRRSSGVEPKEYGDDRDQEFIRKGDPVKAQERHKGYWIYGVGLTGRVWNFSWTEMFVSSVVGSYVFPEPVPARI